MSVPAPQVRRVKEIDRQLKVHKKSRRGCGNCKLRKVKCDEGRPACRKCNDYGTFCNYDPKYSDLQPLVHRDRQVQMLQLPLSENQTILGVINSTTSLGPSEPRRHISDEYHFCTRDLDLLYRFRTRTLLTLGSASYTHFYQNAYAKLVFSHPFLLHIVLTLTLMHDQYLDTKSSTVHSIAIAFHWSRGAALLNCKLSAGIKPSERDPIWACAGLLGALGFSSISATVPEEAWPLKPSSPSDLDWIKLNEGKKAVWEIADPLRADSIFRPMVQSFRNDASLMFSSVLEVQGLPAELIHLCKLDGILVRNSNPHDDVLLRDSNPYLASASFLTHTSNIECNTHSLGIFLSFFGWMHPDLKQLLELKDPCALLLLAYWYAKVCLYQQWWIWRRANLECQAICRYLRQSYSENRKILDLLQYPETVCIAQTFLVI